MNYCNIIQPNGDIILGYKINENNSTTYHERVVKGNTLIIKTNGLVMKLKKYVPIPIDMDLQSESDSDDE